MAIDVLSAMPMSADCERLFSATGLMVSPLRSRLEASTIGITQKLRSWSRAGLVNSKDPMVAVAGDRWQDVQQLVLAVVHTVILVHFLYLEYTLYAFVILNLHTVRVIINHTGSKSYNLTLNLS
jgi:hypothetical protein